MGERRCGKHCLHRVTAKAAVCCHCGRAANVALPEPSRWVPVADHGPNLIANRCWIYTYPGWGTTYVSMGAIR